MKKSECLLLQLGFVLLLKSVDSVDWDLAVSTNTKITAFNSLRNYTATTSAAHQFKSISAITYDDINDRIFFSDREHEEGSIFAIQFLSETSYQLNQIVKNTSGEIVAMAYDPVQMALYWSDKNNQILKFKMNVLQAHAKVFMKFDKNISLQGIAIDFCNRNLYWTNTLHRKATIEMTSLDDPEQDYKVIVQTKHIFKPYSIVVDHYSNRIFWVDDLEGHFYSVESAKFDGSDHTVDFKGYEVEPLNIAVEKDLIYWTDNNNKLWKHQKNADGPVVVKSFSEMPVGIISKFANNFNEWANSTCRYLLPNITKIKVYEEKHNITTAANLCLNGGEFNIHTLKCDCKPGYDGKNCEVRMCHNFCLNGTCILTEDMRPFCLCNNGYDGGHCEIDMNIMCSDYCLNGKCKYENGSRTCKCNEFFYGRHCENFNEAECCENGADSMLCRNCTNEKMGSGPASSYSSSYRNYEHPPCELKTKVIYIASLSSVTTLLLALLIVFIIRKQCRPIRPRIKKTYVVQKNLTPLNSAYRPTTEQCEITIEDCCNMTICETPCFDPKSLQGAARDERRKEDKKQLLMNAVGSNGDFY